MMVDHLECMHMCIVSEMSNAHAHMIYTKQDGHWMVCMFDQVLDQTTALS